MALSLPFGLLETVGEWEKEDEAGVATPPGEDSRDESEAEDPPIKEAVEESLSFDGTLDCDGE